MKKISKEQKKIIYISAIVLAFFILFWLFVYRPQGTRLISLKRQLSRTETQIADINRLTEGQDLAQAVKKLQLDLDKLSGQLPKGEDEVIHNLSEEARRLRINVRNIDSLDSKILDYQIGSHNIKELSISMSLVCEFRQFGRYLNILRNNFPVLIQVRQIEIKGRGEGSPDLDISLEISAFLTKGS